MAWQTIGTPQSSAPSQPSQWQPIVPTSPTSPPKSSPPQTPTATQPLTPSPNRSAPTIPALAGNLGGGYGTSNQTDPFSGKPLLTFENVNANQSQLLSDRTAPPFDPTVPQKIDPSILQNGRMPESISQAIKAAFPGSLADELDHIMPLELGGSNNKSNLRLEPGQNTNENYNPSTNPTATDPLENALAQKAHSGQISLVDAWKLMAQAKGFQLPEQGGTMPDQNQIQPNKQTYSNPFSTFLTAEGFPSSSTDFADKFPSLTQTLADLQTNPASLGSSLKEIIATPFTDALQASDAFNATLATFLQGIKSGAPASMNINNGLQAATSYGAGLITPITTWFNAANKIPIIGTLSKLLLNVPLSLLGDLSGNTGVAALQKLSKSNGGPIPDQAVQNLTPGIRAISTLAGQIALGKYIAPDVLDTLTKTFGKTDAQTINDQAQTLSQEEQKTLPSNPPQETPAPQPTKELPVESVQPQPSSQNPNASTNPDSELFEKPENTPPPKMLISDEIGKVPTSKPPGALRPIEGTGETKTRGLSQGVTDKAIMNTPSRLPSFAPDEARSLEQAQIASKLTDIFGDLPTYKQMDVADQGARALDLFEKDPESAKQIAYGTKAPPKGLTPEAVFIAVEQDAIERADYQTLKELANSRLTEEANIMGKRIRMLAERNPESPTEAIRAVQEARIEAAKKPIAEETTKAETNIKKATADRVSGRTKITWDSFVESITC